MELQTIAASRADFFTQVEMLGHSIEMATGKTPRARTQNADALSLEEFEAYRTNWVDVHSAWRSRSLPITPLPAVTKKRGMTIEDAVAMHVAQLVASSPMEVKCQVVFRTNAAGEFY